MKGVGSYNDWAYYASPSSNLSAFAAPFSVNRSTSNEFGDSAESADAVPSIHFPVRPRSYGYDFFSNPVRELDSTPSSKPYGFSGLPVIDSPSSQLHHFNSLGLASKDAFAYDQSSNTTKPSLVEAQPYYPSYVSSPIHDPTSSVAPNHWSPSSGLASLDGSSVGDYAKKSPEIGFTGQWSGLWNQFGEFNQGKSKKVGVGSSFSSNQTHISGSVVEESLMNQGCQDGKDSNNGEVLHTIGWEKQSVPISAEQLDDKSCWWETIKPMPVEFSSTSVMGSPSVSLETHHEAPLKLVADSGNRHLSYTSSYDKHLRHHDKPSTPLTGLVKDLNVGNIIADGDLGSNNFYNMKEAYRMPSPGTAGCFDLGQLHMHLERNEPTSSNNAMISDKSVTRDVVDYIFKERNGFQNPHASLDNLSLRLSANEGVNSVEKSFDSADRCNPAVDSPCWKGAPAAHFSHYEASEALPPEYVLKNEQCFGSIIQGSQNFLLDADNNVKKSCENSKSYQMNNEIDCQETSLAGSPRKFSVTKLASEDCNSDGAVNAGHFQSEPNSDCGLQYLDDITEMKENIVPPTKPIYDCESRSSHTEHQVIEENKMMFQKQNTLCRGGADAGCNVNECFEYGTSHTVEHTLSSPYLVVDASTKLEKSAGKASTQKLDVQMLVDTMHNLSELLLCHCSNDASGLKERDHNVLKNVISNLNTCALKNTEQISPAQECFFPQPETFRYAGESYELQQNGSFKGPELTKLGSESSKVELENPLVQEAKSLHFRSGKPHWKLSDSISPRGDAEMTKEDNMTKALKRILSENFHDEEGAESQTVLYKNLWLEAEAALCSVYYRARYNQMKIEMEKCSYKQRDNAVEMEGQSKPDVVPSLSKSQSSATKVHIDPNPDSSAQDLPVLNATNLKELSGLKFSTDLNKPNALTPEGKVSQDLDSFIQNSTICSTNKEAGDDEASVIARFHVIKARVDKSYINTANLEELSDVADKLASRGRDNQNQVNFCQDLPIPSKNKADYEASVMARFHIVKSRVEDSSSISSEGQLLDGVGFAGKGIDGSITKNASEGKSLDVHINPTMMPLSSYTAVDKSIPREFHLDLEDNQEIQPHGTYRFGNQPPTYYSDGLASDWEHVEKRSL